MYFTNISNPELLKFKHRKIKSFAITLSNVLKSEGFFSVEVINDTIYRVYPLFYCDRITSSNKKDIIINNNCVICEFNKDTVLDFINDNDEVIVTGIYSASKIKYNINDDLTDEEFNKIVQLYRYHNISLDLRINDGLVENEYGSFLFDLNKATITDKGVLITNNTLESLGSVKLLDPFFDSSSYQLVLSVVNINDVNINDFNVDDDNINVDSLIIDLKENETVDLPFNQLDLNNTVLFDAKLIINHNKPVIQYNENVDINIISDRNIVIGDTVTLTANYTDIDGGISGVEVIFLVNGEEVGRAITDEKGYATLEYTVTNVDFTVGAVVDGVSFVNNTPVTLPVEKKQVIMNLETDKVDVVKNDVFTIHGDLIGDGESLIGNKVQLYLNNEFKEDYLINDNTGFTFNVDTALLIGNVNVKVVFEGNEIYKSDSLSLNVNVKYNPYLTSIKQTLIKPDPDEKLFDYILVTGNIGLKDINNNIFHLNAPTDISINYKLKLTFGESYYETNKVALKTGADGSFEFKIYQEEYRYSAIKLIRLDVIIPNNVNFVFDDTLSHSF